MFDYPWGSISQPDESRSLTARRADSTHPYDFYWGKDFQGRLLFIMRFAASSRQNKQRFPNLKGLELAEHVIDESTHQLVLALKEQANSDLFYRLCQDLLESTRACEEEKTALATVVARLNRWQQLLKAGRAEELSEQEQKGLIGELLFLQLILFPLFSPGEVMAFWQGPVAGEGEKDFAIGDVAVEIKTRASSAPARVHISSEGQLDEGNFDALVLGVFELSAASGDNQKAFNLTGLVSSIREYLLRSESSAMDLFEQRLWNTGYSDAHDYQANNFQLLGKSFFLVAKDFPRISTGDVPYGISGISYCLEIKACEDFGIDEQRLAAMLGGGR